MEENNSNTNNLSSNNSESSNITDIYNDESTNSSYEELKQFILTLKVNINENNINKVIVPDSINIDQIISNSTEKYLDKLSQNKIEEINQIKDEIKKLNSDKMLKIFEKFYNKNSEMLNYRIDNVINSDSNNDTNIKYDSKITEESDNASNYNKDNSSNPFNINTDSFNDTNESNDSSDPFIINTLNLKNENIQNEKIQKNTIRFLNFSKYFDCIYLINLPNEKFKIKKIIDIFDNKNVRYKIIDGIIVENNIKYLKYYSRWRYQKNLDEKLLNKFIFDENIYLRNNKDLKDLKSKTKLWNHYLNFGKSQNRTLYNKTSIKLESELGNLIAHQNAIKDAKLNKYSKILILEDDVFIHKEYNELHKDLIKKIKKFNVIYYGCIQKNWNNINLEDNNYKVDKCYGAFAYALDKSTFDPLLEITNNLEKSMEKCLIDLCMNFKKCYVSYPNIFITDLENGKIHRKRDFKESSEKFKWNTSDYII